MWVEAVKLLFMGSLRKRGLIVDQRGSCPGVCKTEEFFPSRPVCGIGNLHKEQRHVVNTISGIQGDVAKGHEASGTRNVAYRLYSLSVLPSLPLPSAFRQTRLPSLS